MSTAPSADTTINRVVSSETSVLIPLNPTDTVRPIDGTAGATLLALKPLPHFYQGFSFVATLGVGTKIL